MGSGRPAQASEPWRSLCTWQENGFRTVCVRFAPIAPLALKDRAWTCLPSVRIGVHPRLKFPSGRRGAATLPNYRLFAVGVCCPTGRRARPTLHTLAGLARDGSEIEAIAAGNRGRQRDWRGPVPWAGRWVPICSREWRESKRAASRRRVRQREPRRFRATSRGSKTKFPLRFQGAELERRLPFLCRIDEHDGAAFGDGQGVLGVELVVGIEGEAGNLFGNGPGFELFHEHDAEAVVLPAGIAEAVDQERGRWDLNIQYSISNIQSSSIRTPGRLRFPSCQSCKSCLKRRLGLRRRDTRRPRESKSETSRGIWP